jgi:5-methylcytosine-specific restriction enzyme A
LNEPEYYILDPVFTDPKRLRKERDAARTLKKSSWWRQKIQQGLCNYCEKRFNPAELTMDHVVPLARGGKSVKGNIVPSCQNCNKSKKLSTPADQLIKTLV